MMLQSTKPWISTEDIEKGSNWLIELNNKLTSHKFAIICLTPENLKSDWILFECGALAKALKRSYVCPLLIDLEAKDISGPLAQFQGTQTTKSDIKKLITIINSALDNPITSESLNTLYDHLWPDIEKIIENAISIPTKNNHPKRAPDQILGEILETVRNLDRKISQKTLDDQNTSLLHKKRNLSLRSRIDIMHIKGILLEIDTLTAKIKDVLDEKENLDKLLSTNPKAGVLDPSLSARRELLSYRLQDYSNQKTHLEKFIDGHRFTTTRSPRSG